MSLGSNGSTTSSSQAHPTRVSTLSGQASALSGQFTAAAGGAPASGRGSCCLSAAGLGLSGRPAPAEGVRLPCGRPTRHRAWTSTGLSRSTQDRCDRGGHPLYPGGGGALPTGQISPVGTCRFAAASPYLPLQHPIGGSADDEASPRVHTVCPSGLPQPVPHGWNVKPWASPSGFAPRSCPRRTPRWGRSMRTGPGITPSTSSTSSGVRRYLVRPRVARSG